MPSTVEVVDPRIPGDAGIDLAPRLGHLDEKEILLVDNGKARSEFGEFAAFFRCVERQLAEAETAAVLRRTFDLLKYDAPGIEALAKELAVVDAVVLGVADTGVAAPTVLLAAELERLGIPTALACQGIGVTVTEGLSGYLIPGLPCVVLEVWRLSTYAEVENATKQIWPEIHAALTQQPSTDRDHKKGSEREAAGRSNLVLGADEVDDRFTQAMEAEGFGDGLSLRAPTQRRVETMLRAMSTQQGELVWPTVAPRRYPVTARDVAAVAVMAGCPLRTGPIVLEAFRAMAHPAFRLFQAAITTHPCGTLVLVSGPARFQSGMVDRFGSLGPGKRANATIGRSVALASSFLLGARPGHGNVTLQGSPAGYSYCTAENCEDSPWPGLHVDIADSHSSTVTVLKCEAPHNILDNTSTEPASLLGSIADTASTLGGNNLYVPQAQTVVFLNPEHARIVARAGWTKRDVQMFLFEHARRSRSKLVRRGIAAMWKPWVGDRVPIVEDPSDIIVVVTGAPGPQSQVAIPWGYSRGITRVLRS